MISVIVCTYKRAETLKEVLDSLKNQIGANFELLIIDGSGDDTRPFDAVKEFEKNNVLSFSLRFIKSEKGLTKQRNVGLKNAKGDIIAFFDDDVTFDSDFLRIIADIFKNDTDEEIAGITGYDIRNYPTPITSRLKLRNKLGIIPDLTPGKADELGRHTPISILEPTEENMEIGWMSGFCMIYRANKIQGLQFDEQLPTYGGEDRDFSLSASTRGKLMLYGNLKISHNISTENRSDDLRRLWESSYGIGRSFAKRKTKPSDRGTILKYSLGEFLIDLSIFIKQPNMFKFKTIFTRPKGYIKGLKSVTNK